MCHSLNSITASSWPYSSDPQTARIVEPCYKKEKTLTKAVVSFF